MFQDHLYQFVNDNNEIFTEFPVIYERIADLSQTSSVCGIVADN